MKLDCFSGSSIFPLNPFVQTFIMSVAKKDEIECERLIGFLVFKFWILL